jgi:hypothetical protein
MTDPSRSADTAAETDQGSTGRYPGIPRWVKVAGIVVLALALLFGISHFAGLLPDVHGAGTHGTGTHQAGHQP